MIEVNWRNGAENEYIILDIITVYDIYNCTISYLHLGNC